MCPASAASPPQDAKTSVPTVDDNIVVKTEMTTMASPSQLLSSSSSSFCNVDIQNCTPAALAEYLVKHRFQGNAEHAAQFLQAARKTMEQPMEQQQPAAAAVALQQQQPESVTNPVLAFDFGKPLLDEPLETSLLTPRAGKVSLQLYEQGLVATHLKNPSIQLVLKATSVSHLLLFAKPEDCKTIVANHKSKSNKKQPNAHLVLLRLEPAVIFQKKAIDQVCVSLPWTKQTGPTGPKLNSDGEATSTPTAVGWKEATEAWKQVFAQALLGGGLSDKLVVSQVEPQKATPFRSYESPDTSTTTGGMPFIRCYHGVQDGVLYPLEEGLLFYKPPKFLPRSQLHAIACGRAMGGNASRYVDMTLDVGDGNNDHQTVEFTNIQREELPVVNEYIQSILIPAMKRDVVQQEKQKKNVSQTNNDDGDDDDSEATAEEAQADSEDDDGEDDEISDEDDEKFEEDDEESDDEDEDSDEDDDGGIQVVEDDFAKELVKKRSKGSTESSTESEDEDTPRSKRRRRSGR